jgi:ATP synthase protein I
VKNKRGYQGAKRLLLCQFLLTASLAVLSLVFMGVVAAQSVLLGGMVSVVPNAYFARKLFQYQGARAARQIVNSFYSGEALKLALTFVLFAIVFKFFKIVPLVFFAAYILAQMVFWFAPLIFDNNWNRPESD